MTDRAGRPSARTLAPMLVVAAIAVRCGGSPTGPDDDDATLPAAPVLVSPVGGIQVSTDTPTFTVQNARHFNAALASYTFAVLTRSGARQLAATTVPAGRGTTSAVFAAPLPRGMSVTWKVTASGSAGQVASATGAFLTASVECRSVRSPYAKEVVEWFVPACSLAGNAYNDPQQVLGPPDAGVVRNADGTRAGYFGFMSLGEKGHVTVDMGGCALDGEGADLRVYQSVSNEPVTIYAAGTPDGPFILIGDRVTCGVRTPGVFSNHCDFDLAEGEVSEARYFRIEDGEHYPCAQAQTNSEGADVDAVEMLNRKP